MDYKISANQINHWFANLEGMEMKLAQMTLRGFEMRFEDDKRRAELCFFVKIYPDRRVIIDTVNDLTITVEVKVFSKTVSADSPLVDECLELPYATWFGEDYM